MVDLKTRDKAAITYYTVRIVMAVFLVSSASFGIGFLFGSTEVVEPGEKAVKTSGGTFAGVHGPGINLGIPLYDQYTVFDMRHNLITKTGDDSVKAVTADNINVHIELKARWDIADGRSLEWVYKNIARSQSNLRQKVVLPALESSARLCANEMQSEAVISTKREEYVECTKERFASSVEEEGLVVPSLEVVNMEYPESLKEKFQEARSLEEEREIAEQKVEIAKTESRAQVVRAQNRAEAAKILSSRLSQEYLRYIYITEGLNSANTVYVVPADGNFQTSGEIPIGASGESGVNATEVFNGTSGDVFNSTSS